MLQYYLMTPPTKRRRLTRVLVPIAVALVLAAAVTAYLVTLPLTVTVDGETVRVPAGTTVGFLRAQGYFNASNGDLMSIEGTIAAAGAGGPVRVFRNGGIATVDQQVYRGDDLVSRKGLDRVEPTETAEVPIEYGSDVSGMGPIIEVSHAGQKGVRRVVRGAVSGIEITSTVLAEPVDEVLVRRPARPGSKLVALTFDDGPWPKQTDRILQILAEEDVRATFFMLGGQVKRHPDIARRVAAGGHQLGSHSLRHKPFSSLKPAQIRNEFKGGRRTIRAATGVSTTWIRPPYGSMNKTAWSTLRRIKAHVVMWDVDSNDWRRPGAKKIAQGVASHVKPGSIVLFHDGGGDRTQTAAALRSVIRRLRAKGYLFVTVQELVAADGVAKRPAARKASVSKP